jgi:hypothetical protein
MNAWMIVGDVDTHLQELSRGFPIGIMIALD